VREDPVANLGREVQRRRDLQRMLVVAEAPAEVLLERMVERFLTGVAERRMAHVVSEADRLDEIFVQPQGPRDAACDRRRLQRVRHARAVVVACRVDEDLGLAFEPAERLRVEDAVAVVLERRAQAAFVLLAEPSPRLVRLHGERREPALLVLAHLRLEGAGDRSRNFRHANQAR
jgi:hypothetical protein